MPQAVEVERKTEQECLANLNRQAASGGPRGEFAFYRGESGFDFDALAVGLRWKAAEHQIANFAVGDTATLGRDDALRSQTLPNVLMIGFGIELRICQHQADGRAAGGHIQQGRQKTHVRSRSLMGPLRQQNLLLHIHDDYPLQPMTMARTALGLLFHAPDEETADGIVREARPVDRHHHRSASPLSETTHGFTQPAIDGVVWQPPQKAIERGVVGHRLQMQRGAQLLVFPQARLGFAEGPVFVAHQQQHRQQLRLGELMLAEAGAVGWQNLRGHLQRHASKGQ